MKRKANIRDEEKKSSDKMSFEHLNATVPEPACSSTFPYMINNFSFIWIYFNYETKYIEQEMEPKYPELSAVLKIQLLKT